MPHGLDALRQMGLGAAVEQLPGGPFETWRIHLERRFVMDLHTNRSWVGICHPRASSRPGP